MFVVADDSLAQADFLFICLRLDLFEGLLNARHQIEIVIIKAEGPAVYLR